LFAAVERWRDESRSDWRP